MRCALARALGDGPRTLGAKSRNGGALWIAVAAMVTTLGGAAEARASDWTHFGGNPARSAIHDRALPPLGTPAWVTSADDAGLGVRFVGQAGVVCDAEHVYAIGRVDGITRVLAYRPADGSCAWSADLPELHVSSWATPAVDTAHETVIVGAGSRLIAFDGATGGVRWATDLARPVVNASPLVTTDRGAADRAFITDYDGFGDSARLYCVNVDTFESVMNPYMPGEVVWAAAIGSAAGSTPAYDGDSVYVATSGEGGVGAGRVMAFDAGAEEEPPPLWMFENVKSTGFFGGVSVVDGSVYGASYAFSGGRASANLVKLDAGSGVMAWSAGCNRTGATPVVVGDGRIVVSGGIDGFGSLPTVQVFRDLGASAVMEWDSAAATWADADTDGKIDAGEYTPMGGWTHQPVVSVSGEAVLLVGAIPVGGEQYSACTDLYQIDLDAEPGSEGWIAGAFAGAGSTPAVDGGVVYTVGQEGLYAFGGCAADCDASGGLDLFDFLCFQNAFVGEGAYGDCNGDGAWDLFDFLCFQNGFVKGCG